MRGKCVFKGLVFLQTSRIKIKRKAELQEARMFSKFVTGIHYSWATSERGHGYRKAVVWVGGASAGGAPYQGAGQGRGSVEGHLLGEVAGGHVRVYAARLYQPGAACPRSARLCASATHICAEEEAIRSQVGLRSHVVSSV